MGEYQLSEVVLAVMRRIFEVGGQDPLGQGRIGAETAGFRRTGNGPSRRVNGGAIKTEAVTN